MEFTFNLNGVYIIYHAPDFENALNQLMDEYDNWREAEYTGCNGFI